MTHTIKIALFRSSSKKFEDRIPIHPTHLDFIDSEIKSNVYAQKNYSDRFGCLDNYYNDKIKLEDRNSLISSADICLFVRPTHHDIQLVKEGGIVLGWFHCVQNQLLTRVAVDRKLTLICMEGLFREDGRYFFEENSRITGRQAINYALEKSNRLGNTNQKIAVIGHGSAGTAAIKELKKLGFKHILSLSRRNRTEIMDTIESIQYSQINYISSTQSVRTIDGKPLINTLCEQDIIINASTQDIYNPVFYLKLNEFSELKKNTLIIDISCDSNKMSFDFANITDFDIPIMQFGRVSYCAIDHLPTIEYDNATKEISSSILNILPSIYEYLVTGKASRTLNAAIQIKDGVIINPDITYYRERFL